jgi:protein-S-isoprenylcysteine O-methyltransferase Ste14
MYAAFYPLSVAFFLLTANWFIGLSWLAVLTLVVVRRVPREEAAMISHFGDAYREYASRTGRFLPRI